VLRIGKDKIPLSASVKDPTVYPLVEKALDMNFSSYALGETSGQRPTKDSKGR
jgi:hypothetical protein